MRQHKIKPVRKPTITKAALHAEIARLTAEIEWGKKIVGMQQVEVDRLIKLNASLIITLNNISTKWSQ